MLLAACAAPRAGPGIRVAAARGPEGLRVCFRRAEPLETPRKPRLEADGGTLDEVVVSPDLRSIAALWRDPAGELRCRFPTAGGAVFRAGESASDETVTYVLLDEPGTRVTMTLERACPMRPAVPVRVRTDARPARLVVGGTAFDVDGPDTTVTVPLPRDRRGPVLAEGDLRCVLETASGRAFGFLLGVDPDGVPTASSGYVETGPQG